ncbi:Uncharacterised protein [Mesomycoplasma conjunctivae]|nr:Uncharacterised protein [Mesomycoplasma conjunctivae]
MGKTNGEFTHSQKASLLLELYAKKNNPVILWLEENAKQHGEKGRIYLKKGTIIRQSSPYDTYLNYQSFCEKYGYKPLSVINFSEEIITYYADEGIQSDGQFWRWVDHEQTTNQTNNNTNQTSSQQYLSGSPHNNRQEKEDDKQESEDDFDFLSDIFD